VIDREELSLRGMICLSAMRAWIGRGHRVVAAVEAAGYTVELDVWDWAVGENVVLCTSDALARGPCWSSGHRSIFENPVHHRRVTAMLAKRPGPEAMP
jgi:hypothetical protein